MGSMEHSFNMEKIFHWCLFFFLLISTFFYKAVPMNMPLAEAVQYGYMVQELFFRYGIILIFGISILILKKRDFKDWHFLLFFLYSLISSFFDFDIAVRRGVLNIFVALIFHNILIEKFNFKYFRTLCYFCIFIVVMNLVMMIFQYFGKDPIFTGPSIAGKLDSLVGMMKLKVNIGILGAILTPFLIHLNPWYAILTVPMLIFGFSSLPEI